MLFLYFFFAISQVFFWENLINQNNERVGYNFFIFKQLQIKIQKNIYNWKRLNDIKMKNSKRDWLQVFAFKLTQHTHTYFHTNISFLFLSWKSYKIVCFILIFWFCVWKFKILHNLNSKLVVILSFDSLHPSHFNLLEQHVLRLSVYIVEKAKIFF